MEALLLEKQSARRRRTWSLINGRAFGSFHLVPAGSGWVRLVPPKKNKKNLRTGGELSPDSCATAGPTTAVRLSARQQLNPDIAVLTAEGDVGLGGGRGGWLLGERGVQPNGEIRSHFAEG